MVTGPVTSDWHALRDAVSRWRPDVIVAVARKMPRIDEALSLRFESIASTMSDLALPFAAPYISGARVAVVDDIINVGSTMDRAALMAEQLGAREVMRFALHCRGSNDAGHRSSAPVTLTSRDPYSIGRCELVARQAPLLISQLNKSYDLDFPIIKCELTLPYAFPNEFFAFLVDRFGQDAFDLTSAAARENGLHRYTVDRSSNIGHFGKARLYLNARTREVNLVPMRISAPLGTQPDTPSTPWAQQVWNRLQCAAGHHGSGETNARIRLFVDSVEFAIDFLSEVQTAVQPLNGNLISSRDAATVFGPAGRDLFIPSDLVKPAIEPSKLQANPIRSLRLGKGLGVGRSPNPTHYTTEAPDLSPAFGKLFVGSFENELRELDLVDPLLVSVALFDQLARWVGSDNPNNFKLTWPMSLAEIRESPYLRLRIGFTAPDITAILKHLIPQERAEDGWKRTVSKILDQLIDAGTIVPTIANYDGRYYRVYRKGEPGQRDESAARFLLALGEYARPMTRSRMSKIGAIVSFAIPTGGTLTVAPEEHGNVLNIDGDLVDEDAEITQFLSRTQQIRPSQSSSDTVGRD